MPVHTQYIQCRFAKSVFLLTQYTCMWVCIECGAFFRVALLLAVRARKWNRNKFLGIDILVYCSGCSRQYSQTYTNGLLYIYTYIYISIYNQNSINKIHTRFFNAEVRSETSYRIIYEYIHIFIFTGIYLGEYDASYKNLPVNILY